MQAIHCVLSQLSDVELLAEMTRLVRRECEATSDLVASLAEVDFRRLYLGLGYSSLFTYCVKALGFSEDAAYSRIEVARAAGRFPMLLERLAAGAVSLTCARLLAPHLTEENHTALLEEARGKSKRDIEAVIAALASRPDARALVRKLPVRGSVSCTFVGASGKKCCERGFLEYHHVVPYVDGGAATVDNLQLRCKSHNGYEASPYFPADQ